MHHCSRPRPSQQPHRRAVRAAKTARNLGVATLLLVSGLASQSASFDVTTTADNGPSSLIPNSLRWAIIQVVATTPKLQTATINLRVAGTVVVKNLEFNGLPTGIAVTIQKGQGFPASGRFTIDARGTASTTIANGLVFQGAGSKITAPMNILIGKQGSGLVILAKDVSISDLEVTGARATSHSCVTAAGPSASNPLTGLVFHRLILRSAPSGLVLRNCRGAIVGSSPGPQVQSSDCANGFFLESGTLNSIPNFQVRGCETGVAAIAQTGLRLGSPSGPRSQVLSNSNVGIIVQGNSAQATVENLDVKSTATGIVVSGGSTQTTLKNLLLDQNSLRAIDVTNNATNTTIGPDVRCRNTGAWTGFGLVIGPSKTTLVQQSEFGPGNWIGATITAGAAEVTFRDCKANGNVEGITSSDVTKMLIERIEAKQNTGNGVSLVRAHDTQILGSDMSDNTRLGLRLEASNRVTLGPGNTTSNNGFYGMNILRSDDCKIHDSASSNNSGPGANIESSKRAIVTNSRFVKNSGQGLFVWRDSSDCTIGPGNRIEDTIGIGVKLELTDNVTVEGNQILRSTAGGIGIVEAGVSRRPHTLVSNLIDGMIDATKNPPVVAAMGIGTRFAGNPVALKIIGCTVVNNVRGIYAVAQGTTAYVSLDSSILWNNTIDDYNDQAGFVTAQYSTTQNPQGTGTNSSANPLFVSPATGNWVLGPASPAVDAGNPQVGNLHPFSTSSQDARGRDRIVDCRIDRGAVETQYLTADTDKMPLRGGKVRFTVDYPASLSGKTGAILLSITDKPPQPYQLLGRCFPLYVDFWTAASLNHAAPLSQSMLHSIPASGKVQAAIDYTGIVPPGLEGLRIHAVAAAATTNALAFVSGTVEITLRR